MLYSRSPAITTITTVVQRSLSLGKRLGPRNIVSQSRACVGVWTRAVLILKSRGTSQPGGINMGTDHTTQAIDRLVPTLEVEGTPATTRPYCIGMEELSIATEERAKLEANPSLASSSPLHLHLSQGLAYTTGSALGTIPPTSDACLSAFLVSNKVGLTAGARAWSKHAHRSGGTPNSDIEGGGMESDAKKKAKEDSAGWWGTPFGPVASINERALGLFWKITRGVSWRNLHWLPHNILVYEMRVPEGYGMRWSQDQSGFIDAENGEVVKGKEQELSERPWIFRGFVEPMMENGHELGWRH